MIRSKVSEQDSVSRSLLRDSEESELHKKTIERIAVAYSRSGYEVKADHIQNFEYPEKYRMIKPDIVAEKDDQKILIEVETESSIGNDREKRQRREFGKWAKQSSKRDFRREIVL